MTPSLTPTQRTALLAWLDRLPAGVGMTANQFKEEVRLGLQRMEPPTLDQFEQACEDIGAWLSAALEDDNVCDQMKQAIEDWFSAMPAYTTDQLALIAFTLRSSAYIGSEGIDTAAQQREISAAASDVIAERQRQIDGEGWTLKNDDRWGSGEMACAAACYALYSSRCAVKSYPDGEPEYSIDRETLWPWGFDWWKPKDRRRDLVRAGALIIAEIERIDRAAFNASRKAGGE